MGTSSDFALYIDDLEARLRAKEAVIIVGAGVAIGASGNDKLASWLGLLWNGIERCEGLGLVDSGWVKINRNLLKSKNVDDMIMAAERITTALGGPKGREFGIWLRQTVGNLQLHQPGVIQALGAFGVPLLTTNYDGLLEKGTGLETVIWKNQSGLELAIRNDPPAVVHIHGYWNDPETVILGIRAYDKVVDSKHLQTMLQAVRALRTLVFVGCGDTLKDPNLGGLLRWSRGVFGESPYRHYRLALNREVGKLQRQHPPEDGIVVVPFGKDHSDLEPFLKNRLLGGRTPTPTPIPPTPPPRARYAAARGPYMRLNTAPPPRARYATLIKGQLDKLPDVFRGGGGGPRTIEAVYVEVTLAAHERELDYGADAPHAQGRKVSGKFVGGVEDLHGRVPLTRVLAHPRRLWGLLGEPGGGKTTLLRHVAIELLKDTSGPLPIYLKVAELEHGLAKAITALCSSFDADDLAQFVLDEAQAGRAVLLLDGLDEAIDLPAARRWVAGVATKMKECQVIVASRPIGYTEPSAEFNTLTICPLAAEQQAKLLTRWVNDRAKVIAALERLSRTPRLRRLAENPLLLTLVGLLLREGKDVPSRRGDLYYEALQILLKRRNNTEDAAPVAPMQEPELTLELIGWAALRLHSEEGEAYRRDALITALEADARNAARLGKHWTSPAAFVAEVAERTGLLIPDTGRVRDASTYSFPHRTFREFLAATALERDMGAVAAGVASGAGELTRVFTEGEARPERWAEVLALTCGRLGPGGADALVQRITEEANRALLLRVVADAEGISAETVRGTLNLGLGWDRKKLLARQRVIEEIPALVKDLAVAVGLLEQVARSTTCGHDLFWVREVLRRIARGEVEGGVLEGTVEEAKRAAKGAADNVLSHLPTAKREELLALLKPWWRPIPAGSFDMGGTERDDEKPIHRVTFTPGFYMLGVPVTWAMYRLFDPGHDTARDDFEGKLPPEVQDEVPVYNVSWYASVMFAEWVGARLPLEPEWEYACRAGSKTRFWSGDKDEDLVRVGWYSGNAQGHPHPVAQKPKNAWGLHDVHGNVWEWCADAYDGNAYAARADGLTLDPWGLTEAVGEAVPMSAESAGRGAPRVLRGGSWRLGPEVARSANRYWTVPWNTGGLLGFRLLLSSPERP